MVTGKDLFITIVDVSAMSVELDVPQHRNDIVTVTID